MAERIDTCPNCGYRREIKVILSKMPGQALPRSRGKWLHSMAPAIPSSALGQFWHRVVRNLELPFTPPPSQERIIVRSEIKTSKYQIQINEREIRATEAEIRQLADVYERRGEPWARATTERETSMGQGKHNNIKDDFLKLGFLKQVSPTKYELTHPGRQFLRGYLH